MVVGRQVSGRCYFAADKRYLGGVLSGIDEHRLCHLRYITIFHRSGRYLFAGLVEDDYFLWRNTGRGDDVPGGDIDYLYNAVRFIDPRGKLAGNAGIDPACPEYLVVP